MNKKPAINVARFDDEDLMSRLSSKKISLPHNHPEPVGREIRTRLLRQLMRVASAATVSALIASAASAQTSSGTASKTSSEQSEKTIAEIVVVAERHTQTLINVPVAATAKNYAELQQYGTNSLTSIGDQMPQLQLLPAGGATNGASFSIRGVGNLAVDYGAAQPVGLVIDGMSIARGHVIDLGAFDVANVQVFAGPQALLFGKNSPAGVVVLNTVNPANQFGGYTRAGYDFDTHMPYVEGAVSIPVSDTFAIRLAARYRHMSKGTVDNLAQPIADPFPFETSFMLPGAASPTRGKSTQSIGRLTAVWQPTTNFNANLKFTASHYKDDGQAGTTGASACAPGNAHPTTIDLLAPTFAFQDPFGPCTLDNGQTSNGMPPLEVAQNFIGAPGDGKPFTRDKVYLTSLNMQYDVGTVTLHSTTGVYYANQSGFDNYGYTVWAQALNAQPYDNDHVFNEEIRATSNFEGPLNFNVGGYYERENHGVHTTSKIFPLGPYPGSGPYNGAYQTLDTIMNISAKSYSLFGQLKWDILPTLELAGGARWSHDDKTYIESQLFNFLDVLFTGPLAAYNPFAPTGRVFHIPTSHHNVSPELTLTWHPRADLTIYSAYKEGYLAGGASTPSNLSNYDVLCSVQPGCTDPTSFLLYRPEVARGGELGVKGAFLDGSLYADLTIYRYRFTNLQVTTFDSATTSFFVSNAAASISQGIEAKLTYNINPQFQLHGYLAYTDLHFQKYVGAQCYSGQTAAEGCIGGSQDLSGTKYGGAPLDSNIGVNYHHMFKGKWYLTAGGDLYCHTRAPRSLNNPSDPSGKGYCTENASLRVRQSAGPWEVAIIGRNLSDHRHYAQSVGKPLGAPGDLSATVRPGREVSIQATYEFGD